MFFSYRLFVISHEGGCTRGVDGDGVRQQWGGEQHRGGGVGGNSGGSTVGVSSTSKNRPSHRKYKSPKQFELKYS